MGNQEPSTTRLTLLKWGAPLLLAGAVVGGIVYLEHQREEERQRTEDRHEAEDEAEEEQRLAHLADLREESVGLMPQPLQGLALGMDRAEVQMLRPGMRPRDGDDNEEGFISFEEGLPGGSKAVFLFADETDLLAKVQLLSQLPNAEALGTHLREMTNAYGPPTGIWDCPATDNVTTRRFLWQKERTAVADIFLIYGNSISLTLYIAPIETMAFSLLRSQCRRITREQFNDFPINDPRALLEEAQQ